MDPAMKSELILMMQLSLVQAFFRERSMCGLIFSRENCKSKNFDDSTHELQRKIVSITATIVITLTQPFTNIRTGFENLVAWLFLKNLA